MGLSYSTPAAVESDAAIQKWTSIPLEMKLDVFQYLDRSTLDTCLLVSRGIRDFIEENAHLLGKHVVIKFFIQANGKVSLLWKVDKKQNYMQKYGETLVSHRDLRNSNVLLLEIAELDDEKIELLKNIVKECGPTLVFRSLRVCLYHAGAFSIIALRKLWPYLIEEVVKAEEVNLEILSREVSSLAWTQPSLSKVDQHAKYFNLKLECFPETLGQLSTLFSDSHIEFPNRETLNLKFLSNHPAFMDPVDAAQQPVRQFDLMETIFQAFVNHPSPGLLFHRTVIQTYLVDEDIIANFAAANNFTTREDNAYAFQRQDNWVLELFRTQNSIIVFHVTFSNSQQDQQEECNRCKNYFSFNVGRY